MSNDNPSNRDPSLNSSSSRQLRLGAILIGVGTSQNGWRDPDLPADASIDIEWYRSAAQKAEAAKLDFIFIVDSPFITPDTAPHFLNRLEPLTLLSAVASATSRIGLVATLTASYNEPFNVARQFGSLDLTTTAARSTSSTRCATAARVSTSRSFRVCGIRTRTTPSRATRRAACFSTRTGSTR
jgi:Luciferase-like monooxygenase